MGFRILRYLFATAALLSALDMAGATVTARNKAEFLDAVASASDGNGRLREDLVVSFDASCAQMTVGEADLWNESEKCLLDCGGHRICLDASDCPSGTVVIGGEGGSKDGRAAAIKGCGKGSVFRNLTVVNHGRIEFDRVEDTLVKDCDFINCGSASGDLTDAGGAIRGCATVEGCGFERCRARVGGALSDCGYVVECVFQDCRALDGGGAVAGASDVFRCEFHGCRCDSDLADSGFGGAIYGGRDVVSCLFVDCSAKQGGAIMSVGPLEGQRPKVVHCTFVRCRGGQNGEAVFDGSVDAPLFMLNCLGYGSAILPDDADENEKFGCYRLMDAGFFRDYDKGDFHPNPELPEDWADPCGLRFGESGEAVFVCRDLDGFGYQLSSPWLVCPGCYRFRVDDNEESASPESAGKGVPSVVKPRTSAKPGHWRVPPKSSPALVSESGHSVRNRPLRVVSRRTGSALLDLSELPCEITQNEILHTGDNYLDFASTWYEGGSGISRFFDLRGPLKMPEIGVDLGYGCPGEVQPYEEDEELKALAGRYGFRTGWFCFGFPKEGDGNYQRWRHIEETERRVNETMCGFTNALERIPFLLSPAVGEGKFPLVVYIAGSGEQGTDLKKMFRQTGVFDAVRSPTFAKGHPCHLLAVMPPKYTGGNFVSYPHTYRDCCGALEGVPGFGVGNLRLVRRFADLVFGVQRELAAKGKATVDPDAIVLVGLGTGASAVVTMMREYPGRYAGVCATWPSPTFQPSANRYRPGRWWYAMKEQYHQIDDTIQKMAEAYRKAGADLRLSYYQDGPNWWNAQFSSPEFGEWLAECFEKGPLHGEKLIVARPESGAKLLLAKTGPDEATYYGTVEERPEGLPSEVADRRIGNLKGIRYLYVDGSAREIPLKAFIQSKELETVHIKSYVTNIAAKAFAESPKLNLVVFEDPRSTRIAADAFDGCAPALYGGTIGVPVSVSHGITKGTNTTIYATEKITLKSHALPVEGLFSTHLFLCDDQLHRRLHIEGDFLWSEEGEDGANALMFLGEGRDVFVPDTLGGRPVVALGRNLLHRRWGEFEYGILAIPSMVRSMPLFPGHHRISTVFAACKLGYNIAFGLSPETVVYGTTPDEKTGKLVPAGIGWKGKEVVVPQGTNPRELFARRR